MHCDIAVIYDTESGVAHIPSVSRIIVSQYKHLSVALLQLKLSVKYTALYQRKKQKKLSFSADRYITVLFPMACS